MRRRLLPFVALLLALCWVAPPSKAQPTVVGPGNAILCNKIVSFTGSAALAQIVAAQSGQVINICGFLVTNTAASGTFNLEVGTGTNCGSNTVSITGALSVGSTAVAAQPTFATFTAIPISGTAQALCQNATATITGIVWYSQF